MIDYHIYKKRMIISRNVFLYLFGIIYPILHLIDSFFQLSKKYPFEQSIYVAGPAVGTEKWLFSVRM